MYKNFVLRHEVSGDRMCGIANGGRMKPQHIKTKLCS